MDFVKGAATQLHVNLWRDPKIQVCLGQPWDSYFRAVLPNHSEVYVVVLADTTCGIEKVMPFQKHVWSNLGRAVVLALHSWAQSKSLCCGLL
jgi:hypothetical protein